MPQNKQEKFVEYRTPIAGNYVTDKSVRTTIDNFLSGQIYTFNTKPKKNNAEPELLVNDQLRDNLNYILYNNDIAPLVRRNQSGTKLQEAALHNLISRETMAPYLTSGKMEQLNMMKQAQNGTLKDALVVVTDIENFTIVDELGNKKSFIYNVAFDHRHYGNTIGTFKGEDRRFQHLLLGIHDKDAKDFLKNIKTKVEKKKALTQDEQVAFDYFSRIGASIQDPMDLVNKTADEISLTKADKNVYGTVENYWKAVTGFKKRGDIKLAEAKKLGFKTITTDDMRLADNLAEIIVNDRSLVTGYNVGFDIAGLTEHVMRNKELQQYMGNRITDLQKQAGVPVHKLGIQQLRYKWYDPLQEGIYKSRADAVRKMVDEIFQGNTRAYAEGMDLLKFENMSPALAQLPGLPEELKKILSDTHHWAGTDVKQEGAFFFDIPNSPIVNIYDDLLSRPFGNIGNNSHDPSLGIKGLLFQADSSGSMKSIRDYHKNSFAVVRMANGDAFMSNGAKYEAAKNRIVKTDQFAPGAWAPNVTYQVEGLAVIKQNSKLAKAVTDGHPEMVGDDIVRLDYKIALLDPLGRATEAGQEIHSWYVPASEFEQSAGMLKWIGRIDQKGNAVLNDIGIEQAAHLKAAANDKRFASFTDVGTFKKINEQYITDRAERSFNKNFLKTNENVFMLRDLAYSKAFSPTMGLSERYANVVEAIQDASRGQSVTLDTLLKNSGIHKTADQIIADFTIDKEGFSIPWLSNTATIASYTQFGSPMERMHKEAMKLLSTKEFQDMIGTGEYADLNRNRIYSQMISGGRQILNANMPIKLQTHQFYNDTTGRFVNDVGKFYVNGADFIRRYQSEFRIPGPTEDVTRNWIGIDLDNVYKTASSITRATGLQGKRAEDPREMRRALLSFANFMSENPDIDESTREEFKALFNEDLANKGRYQIAQDITDILGRAKRSSHQGWAPEPVYRASQSYITMWAPKNPADLDPVMEQVVDSMRKIGLEEGNMLASWSDQKKVINQRLKNFMFGHEIKGGRTAYEQLLDGYDVKTKEAMLAIYDQNVDAVNRYSESFLDALNNSGIKIMAGDNQIKASFGGETRDISALFPQLRSNKQGIQSWMIGTKDSQYIAAPVLRYKAGIGFTLGSNLDYALNEKWFGTIINRAIENGENPLDALERLMKQPNKVLREVSPYLGMPTADWRNMMSASMSEIQGNKDMLRDIIALKKYAGIGSDQEKAIQDIENYLQKWEKTGRKPEAGLEIEDAIVRLTAGQDALISPEVLSATKTNSVKIRLNAGAKQTGSENQRFLIAEAPSWLEYQVDPGKMVQNQLDNALYYRKDLIDQHKNILNDKYMHNFGFGAKMATAGEQKLTDITDESGLAMSNRIRGHILEADDLVKNELYKQLVNKYGGDTTIANHFLRTYMPYEGGGWLNGRLWDTLPRTNTWQTLTLTPHTAMWGTEKWKKRFDKYAELQFQDDPNKKFRFRGYGRGIYVQRGDALYHTYDTYNQKYRAVEAKEDSILSVVYTTRDGRNIVDEDTLRKNVSAKLKQLKQEETKENWFAAADSMYKRQVVARRVFDEGIAKISAVSEKHESVAGIRAIADYYSGPITDNSPAWMKEEKFLHDLFYSDEFNGLAKKLDTDFRSGRVFSSEIYEDMATLTFSSPIFGNYTSRGNYIDLVETKMAEFKGIDYDTMTSAQLDDLKNEFYRMMNEARYRTSDAIKELTNADFLGTSAALAVKHKNQDELIMSTIAYLEKQMQKDKNVRELTRDQETADLKAAIQIFNQQHVLRSMDTDQILDITFNGDTPILPTNRFKIDPDALLSLYGFNGTTIEQLPTDTLKGRMNKMMSHARDIERGPNGETILRATTGDLGVLRDTAGSSKLYKISDRELASYSNVLVDQDVLNRVKTGMGDDVEFNRLFGKFLDTNGNVKQDMIGTAMYKDEFQQFFDNFGYMRWKEGSLRGEELYDAAKDYIRDPYRKEKTADLVTRLQKGRPDNVRIAQSFADDLYETASLDQANAFNQGKIGLHDLISDRGRIADADLADKQFFKERHISEILTGVNHAKEIRYGGDVDLFNDNLVIDFTDENAGLNNTTLRRSKIAVAGVDNSFSEDISPTEYQKAVQRAQDKYSEIKDLEVGSAEHTKAVGELNAAIQDIENLHKDYAENKVKTGKPAAVRSTRVAASINNKVQDMYGGVVNKEWGSLETLLDGRTYQGESLIDLYKSGKKPNIAIVSVADLEDMGFNSKYFKDLGIDKEQWLDIVEKEGIQGSAHRWPNDYLGSTMAVQIYVDRQNRLKGTTVYDDITAAFLKADSDGDYAQLMLAGATDTYTEKFIDYEGVEQTVKRGRFVDTVSQRLGANIEQSTKNAIDDVMKNHDIRMQVQINDTNKLVEGAAKYAKIVQQTRDEYIKTIMSRDGDVVSDFIKKSGHVNLKGELLSHDFKIRNATEQAQDIANFVQYKSQIADAMERAGINQTTIDTFSKQSDDKIAGWLRGQIAAGDINGKAIYQELGNNAKAIDQAFELAASTDEAQKVMLQRIARKGIGKSDTVFQVAEFFQQHAVASGRNVLTNKQNAAMYLLKEMDKEQLLTTKQMKDGTIMSVEDNLEALTDLMNRVIKSNGKDPSMRQEFVQFMKETARDPNERYMAESLLKEFVNEDTGLIDVEELWGSAYDGLTASIRDMDENTDILSTIRREVPMIARLAKGRESGRFLDTDNFEGNIGNAISGSNGYIDNRQQIAANAARRRQLIEEGENIVKQRGKNVLSGSQKVVRNFKPGRNLAIAALGLAGAAVFGGYAGGNPAEPAQQQAQQIYEQNPAPRNINMADPSLTASNRKQPGYVININAQTERDKTYASQIITQAVTQNFQNTNVNVSMNVNQQPGNIGANDLVDYLTQAL